MEIEPGSQIQIDYGKMGYIFDKTTGRGRTVFAFIATLGQSPIISLYSSSTHRTRRALLKSHVKMFNYFGGVAHTIRIDNLKSGVIRPDLYDPQLNCTYRKMAEYYDIFIDACRLGVNPKISPLLNEMFRPLGKSSEKSS